MFSKLGCIWSAFLPVNLFISYFGKIQGAAMRPKAYPGRKDVLGARHRGNISTDVLCIHLLDVEKDYLGKLVTFLPVDLVLTLDKV